MSVGMFVIPLAMKFELNTDPFERERGREDEKEGKEEEREEERERERDRGETKRDGEER